MLRPRRAFAATAAGAALITGIAGPLDAQSGEGGYTFAALAGQADGVTAEFAIDALLPVDEIVGLSSVTAEAHLGVGRSDALAALPDPGDLVLTLPGTLGGLTGISGLPAYPAAAGAEHPAVPEDEVILVPDAGLGAGRLRARAVEDGAAASASVTEFVDLVGLLPSFSIGSIATEATSERLSPTSYRTVATSTLSDIRLLGGLLRIDQITTTVTAGVRDGRFTAEATELDVSGADVAGMPVGIGPDGIEGLGQATALAPIVDEVAAPLAAQGIDVRTTPATQDVTDGRAAVTGGALTIEMPITVQDRPGRFVLTLGRASASVEASGVRTSVAIPARAAPSPTVTAARPPSAAPSAAPAVVLGSGSTGTALPATPALPAPAPQAASPMSDLVLTPVGREVADWQVDDLYRAMALGAVAVLLAGWGVRRLAVPPRRRSDLRSLWRW